jgi:hypothetical protein
MSLVLLSILFLICAILAPRYINQEKPVVRLHIVERLFATLAILCVVVNIYNLTGAAGILGDFLGKDQ